MSVRAVRFGGNIKAKRGREHGGWKRKDENEGGHVNASVTFKNADRKDLTKLLPPIVTTGAIKLKNTPRKNDVMRLHDTLTLRTEFR